MSENILDWQQELTMIDHISIGVSDFNRSVAFYDAALAPLGYKRCFLLEADKKMAAYGPNNRPIFWMYQYNNNPSIVPPQGFHLGLKAQNRSAIDAFYQAAIAAGAKDNGPPGLRPQYHANYYAAFAIDPDGYHIEAVCHNPVE